MIETFIPAPTGGVVNAGPLQTQPRGTLYESVNFWPLDAWTGRRVLATRAPLAAFDTPGENVNLFAPISGDATQTPQRTMLAAADGDLYYWDGDSWVTVVSAENITTGRQVFSASYLKRAVIFNDTTPLVFSYDDLTLVDFVASEGTVPPDCRFGVTWRGGLWIAGALEQPHVVSGSRTGNIFDWDFSETDTAAAFQFVGESEGLIGEPVTALIPMSSDVMLVAWVDGMSMLRGHPRRGGILEPVSSKIGVMGQGAWTQGPDFRVYFMSREGIATIGADGGAPSLISRQRIPSELIGLPYDYTSPNINLEYDVRYGGIHITVGGENAQAWFYDLAEGGFHRMTLPEIPVTTTRFDSLETEAASGVLLGGASGINRFDTTATEDFFAQAIVGPLPLSKTAMTATRIEAVQFHFLTGTTYDDSIVALLRAGADCDDVVARYQANSLSRSYQVGLGSLQKASGRAFPKIAGNALTVELYAAGAGSRIVFEGLSLQGAPAGRNRIGAVDAASDDPLNETVTIGFPWLLGGVYAEPDTAPDGPSFATSDLTLFIDLSEMPAEWWARVKSDGADIRVTTSNNALLPADLIAFDYGDQTGLLAVRRSLLANVAIRLRVWCGNVAAVQQPVAGVFGRYNAYPSSLEAFYPQGGGSDHTRNKRHAVASTGVTVGSGAVYSGVNSTRYNSSFEGFGATLEWDSGTAAADPGDGKIRANHANLSSATNLYASKVDASGADISAALLLAGDTEISIVSETGNFVSYHIGSATDSGDYVSLNIDFLTTIRTLPEVSIPMTWSTTTTAGDPGPGNLRCDNLSFATALRFDNLDADGVDRSAVFASMVGDPRTVRLSSGGSPVAIVSISSVTNSTGYYTFAHSSRSYGALVNGQEYTATFDGVTDGEMFTAGADVRFVIPSIGFSNTTQISSAAVTGLTFRDCTFIYARSYRSLNTGFVSEGGIHLYGMTVANFDSGGEYASAGEEIITSSTDGVIASPRFFANSDGNFVRSEDYIAADLFDGFGVRGLSLRVNSDFTTDITRIVDDAVAELTPSGEANTASISIQPTIIGLGAGAQDVLVIDDFDRPGCSVGMDLALCMFYSESFPTAFMEYLTETLDAAAFWGSWSAVTPS